MTDYLSLERIYEVLMEKLIEYQKRFPANDDIKQQFELKIEPTYFSLLTTDAVISTLKEYAGWYASNPFSFLIRDRIRDKDIFKIHQSRSRYHPAWELHELTK
jgi:hypothetical protein